MWVGCPSFHFSQWNPELCPPHPNVDLSGHTQSAKVRYLVPALPVVPKMFMGNCQTLNMTFPLLKAAVRSYRMLWHHKKYVGITNCIREIYVGSWTLVSWTALQVSLSNGGQAVSHTQTLNPWAKCHAECHIKKRTLFSFPKGGKFWLQVPNQLLPRAFSLPEDFTGVFQLLSFHSSKEYPGCI